MVLQGRCRHRDDEFLHQFHAFIHAAEKFAVNMVELIQVRTVRILAWEGGTDVVRPHRTFAYPEHVLKCQSHPVGEIDAAAKNWYFDG